MANDIHNISITDALTVSKPSKHIEYTIQVTTPTRTWSVNRRYNDFVALDAELRASTGKEPPQPLPPKHWFKRTLHDEEKIRERRVRLEQYLRVILTTKDARWRQSFGWSDFLNVVQSKSLQADKVTPASWLTEHGAVEGLLRSARAALLKRDALARVGDPAARQSGMDARKALRDAGPRIRELESSLGELTLGDGEKRRREDLVASLGAEHSNLLRQAEAGYRAALVSKGRSPSGRGTGRSSPSPSGPGRTSPPGRTEFVGRNGGGRVFGRKASPPKETAQTRPLDDRGLVQLQVSQMARQDEQLGALSGMLRTQRKMGEDIAAEVALQNEMLEGLDADVTRVGAKMTRAKRDLNRL